MFYRAGEVALTADDVTAILLFAVNHCVVCTLKVL